MKASLQQVGWFFPRKKLKIDGRLIRYEKRFKNFLINYLSHQILLRKSEIMRKQEFNWGFSFIKLRYSFWQMGFSELGNIIPLNFRHMIKIRIKLLFKREPQFFINGMSLIPRLNSTKICINWNKLPNTWKLSWRYVKQAQSINYGIFQDISALEKSFKFD